MSTVGTVSIVEGLGTVSIVCRLGTVSTVHRHYEYCGYCGYRAVVL